MPALVNAAPEFFSIEASTHLRIISERGDTRAWSRHQALFASKVSAEFDRIVRTIEKEVALVLVERTPSLPLVPYRKDLPGILDFDDFSVPVFSAPPTRYSRALAEVVARRHPKANIGESTRVRDVVGQGSFGFVFSYPRAQIAGEDVVVNIWLAFSHLPDVDRLVELYERVRPVVGAELRAVVSPSRRHVENVWSDNRKAKRATLKTPRVEIFLDYKHDIADSQRAVADKIAATINEDIASFNGNQLDPDENGPTVFFDLHGPDVRLSVRVTVQTDGRVFQQELQRRMFDLARKVLPDLKRENDPAVREGRDWSIEW